DPLGLYSESRRVRVVTTLQSYPRPYPPAVERAGAGLGLAEALASRRAGAGTEFYSLRDYVPGDDVRLVAWLASARAGRPVVRENVEERRLDLCIIADLSLEAWAGSPGESAADWAMRASLALVEASARTAGRVSYSILLGETALWLEPRRAPEAGESMAEAFASTSPSHASPRSGLGRVLRAASEEWPSGCVLVALLGPGGLGDAVTGSPDTWEAISRVAWRMVAVELLPTGATVLEEWLRRSYTRLEEPYLERLRRAGAAAFIAPTPRHLAAALTVGVSSAASRLHGPLAR
ncbi:MAG: DUF58 domain-containing protein, partial [Desulfurococcales archaeon]|nr:DUF58 domain-containing protein [Desulfurococcales archaeon]